MFFFSDFQYGFRSSQSTVDLLIVASDRIAIAFNRPGATQAVTLGISKAFNRVCYILLSVILLSILMTLLSNVSVTKNLICGNKYNLPLNLNLIYETLRTGTGSNLLTSLLEKLV